MRPFFSKTANSFRSHLLRTNPLGLASHCSYRRRGLSRYACFFPLPPLRASGPTHAGPPASGGPFSVLAFTRRILTWDLLSLALCSHPQVLLKSFPQAQLVCFHGISLTDWGAWTSFCEAAGRRHGRWGAWGGCKTSQPIRSLGRARLLLGRRGEFRPCGDVTVALDRMESGDLQAPHLAPLALSTSDM